MSYRSGNSPAALAGPSLRTLLTGMLVAFVALSLLIILAGRMPFAPSVTPISGPSYRDFSAPARERLGSYGRTDEGTIHIPIDQAMDLIVERGLPTRENPSPTP